MNFSQYLALLRVADAFLVTSLREGMALRTHEFVVSQEGKEKEGSLVLSEVSILLDLSGCSGFLISPLLPIVHWLILVLWLPFLHCRESMGYPRNCCCDQSKSEDVSG